MEEQKLSKIALTTKEACEYIGFNRSLLDSYRKAGLIRAIKAGRYFIYPVAELENFISRNIGHEITKDGVIYD
ncbi:MAG: helix-turn-helix domain-containing protein [Erysipelotrichaceae bacterium]|nr:helix-turn-helix domain-containing protein [Erysipelotrichaceae bacterium]